MRFEYTALGAMGLIALVQKLRDAANELEKATRVMMATVMNIHSTPMHQSRLCHIAMSHLTSVVHVHLKSLELVKETYKAPMETIANLVPENQFWR
jgi:hypothetical protein